MESSCPSSELASGSSHASGGFQTIPRRPIFGLPKTERRCADGFLAPGRVTWHPPCVAERVGVMDATGTDRNHPKRALLIDDDEGVRNVIHDIVTLFGYVTDAAANGPEGLALFEKNLYDVVLTDLLM